VPTAKVPVVAIAPLPETVRPGLVTEVRKATAPPSLPVNAIWSLKALDPPTFVLPVPVPVWVISVTADAMGATATDVARSSKTALRQATTLTISALTLMRAT
jgi:hypothetical protein